VLDTLFDDSARFLNCWLTWRSDRHRPHMLHYVGIVNRDYWVSESNASIEVPKLSQLSQQLKLQCQDLGPGFHRIILEHGAVSLTLCVGATPAMLSEQVFKADTLYAYAPDNKWTVQLLARRCNRGTRFCLSITDDCKNGETAERRLKTLLHGAGFQLDDMVSDSKSLTGRFDPPWEIPNNRHPVRREAPVPGRCAVIGAGLAGASVASAMALRGWQVTVVDQEAVPAGGASGLPAGLAVPHVSADDSPRSRLTRNGIRLLAQHARRLLKSEWDWSQSGVLERHADGTALWHPQAAWVKPSQLVKAWLTDPLITFKGNTKVATLHRTQGLWSLSDVLSNEFGPFEVVVVANAMGCSALLKSSNSWSEAQSTGLSETGLADKLSALQAVHGTLSHGIYAEEVPDLPATPVNGNGCFIPRVPVNEGEQWCVGSSFEPDVLAAADTWTQHASNMQRLQHLLPGAGTEIAETLDRGPVSQWSATRCVTHDRLPLVGPVGNDPNGGLWLCVGMGSRGLSFSALCAELLAARLCAEPLPIEFSLSRSLDANRARRKRKSKEMENARPIPFAANPRPGVG
jgi:tRNA 5-methylaminomethyl-2-thiouridine biosynthesis bifunctional protein